MYGKPLNPDHFDALLNFYQEQKGKFIGNALGYYYYHFQHQDGQFSHFSLDDLPNGTNKFKSQDKIKEDLSLVPTSFINKVKENSFHCRETK